MSASSETACRTSSSVLKKCGPRRTPPAGSGRKSQTIPRSPSSLWHGGMVGCRDRDGAAAPLGLARRDDGETGLVAEVDQELGEHERALADPRHTDLLDHVVAGRRRVERGDVRRAGEKAPRACGVLELRLEGERPGMSLPADERGLEPFRDVRPHVEPARARAAAEPLDAAADGEVDAELGQVERHDARRLVAVEHHGGTDLAGSADDRLDVLDLAVLEQDMADGDEQRALVDRVDDRGSVLHGDDLEVGLRLVEVAHRREVRLLVDDAVPLARPCEAGKDDRLRHRHVLMHHDRAGRCTEDPAELVADRDRHLPPAFPPGPDAALAPGARVLAEVVLGRRRHRRERVVDEVGARGEDREPVAIPGRIDHGCAPSTSSSAA